MTDISKMSSDDLMAIANGGKPKNTAVEKTQSGKVDVSKLSNEELFKLATGDSQTDADALRSQERAFAETIIKPIAWVGRQVDRFAGAPTRAAIGAIQDGKNPISAGVKQFGADPDKAPTGRDIAIKAGVSNEHKINSPFKSFETGGYIPTTPAAAVGLGIDVVADPTNLIPFAAAPKAMLKTAKLAGSATKLVAKGTAGLTDLATGTKFASKGLDAVENVAEGAKLATSKLFSPKVSKDFPDYLEIAKRNNIPQDLLPSATEFGNTSIITRAERAIAEGPIGEKLLKKHEAGLGAVRKAVEEKIEKIGGGKVLAPQDAGTYIKNAFDEAVQENLKKHDVTYGKIIKQYPGLSISTGVAAGDEHIAALMSKINGIEKAAKGVVKRGLIGYQAEQGKRLLNATKMVRAGIAGGSFKQAYEALDNLRPVAFPKKHIVGTIPADVEKSKDLYFALSDMLHDAVKKNIGEDVAGELWLNNQETASFIGNKNPLAAVINDPRNSPEDIFRILVQRGDSNTIKSLQSVLGKERIKPVKAAMLDSLINYDINDGFTFGTVANRINKNEMLLKNLLDPDEVKDIVDLVRLGDSFGQPILSSSGTGASNIFRDLKSGMVNSIINEATVTGLKNKARGQLPNISQVTLEQPDSIAARIQMIKGLDPRNLKRGPREKLLKSSQVISVQDRNKEKDEDNALRRRIEAMRNNQ